MSRKSTTPNPFNSIIRNNVVVGCPIGCNYCFARGMGYRYGATDDFDIPKIHKERLYNIYKGKNRVVLLSNMSDPAVWKEAWLKEILEAVHENPQNRYIFETKRPKRLDLDIKDFNVWFGVSVCSSYDVHRIAELKEHVRGAHYLVWFEPLQGDVGEVDFTGIEGIIIGPESRRSGHSKQPRRNWVKNIVRQADEQGVPVCMKDQLADILDADEMRFALPFDLVGLTPKINRAYLDGYRYKDDDEGGSSPHYYTGPSEDYFYDD